jgi:predicted secreted Zn-dependent protease
MQQDKRKFSPDITDPVLKAIYDKRTEIHYNKMEIHSRSGDKIKLNLQGKIKCPMLNTNISSITCSKMMEKDGWPRNIDPEVCKKCHCFVSVSIKKFQEKRTKE